MNQRTLCLWTSLFVLAAAPLDVWADAAGDLADGRATLAAGELDAALKLLTAAGQALPNSVEAQLALAECHLKLGDMDAALARYRAVLKLSPDHALARRIVTALTGQRTSFDQRLAAARSLMELGHFAPAIPLLTALVHEPVAPEQRTAARLLLAEANLWENNLAPALTEALRVVEDSEEAAMTGPARVIAALALMTQANPQPAKATELIRQAEDLEAQWSVRAQLVPVLVQLKDHATATDSSVKLRTTLAAVPLGKFREQVVNRAAGELIAAARARVGRSALGEAIGIVWPMLSGQDPPTEDAVLKALDLTGGWLDAGSEPWLIVGGVLADVAKAEFARSGADAGLLGYWLTFEVYRQSAHANRFAQMINTAGELAALSRPKHDRAPGSVLSTADRLQHAMLLPLAGLVTTEEQRGQIVDLVLGQLARYQSVDDLETGLAQFVSLQQAADAAGAAEQPNAAKVAPAGAQLTVGLAGGLGTLPPGAAHQKLLVHLAALYAELGNRSFQAATASLAQDANQSVQQSHVVALMLLGQAKSLYPTAANIDAQSDAIIQQYATADRWSAAEQATRIYFAHVPGAAGRWALVKLHVQQAIRSEDQRLTANRRLSQQLDELVAQALVQTVAILKESPGKESRRAAIQIAGSLVSRYADLDRLDLSEAVIARAADVPDGTPLADWAVWMRASLLERQARAALARAASQFNGAANVALNELHRSELELLSTLLADHPQSEYVGSAVERVLQIAVTYEQYQAFDVAHGVLADFVQAHPTLSNADAIAFRAVQVLIAKAQHAFSQRKDPQQTPAALSAEYVAAIAALAEFLNDYPSAQHVPAAETALFAVAQVYGQANAWPVVRDVLSRFAKAVPDFRSPAQLRFLEAATYLGELDRDYALSLLQLAPPPKPQPAAVPGGTSLAMAGGMGRADFDGDFGDRVAGFAGGGFGYGEQWGAGGAGGFRSDASEIADEAKQRAPAGGLAATGQPATSTGAAGGLDAYLKQVQPPVASEKPSSDASAMSLAMIQQSQQRQFQQIAMLEQAQQANAPVNQQADNQAIALPSGSVLSEAEMKRQDDAADKAYAILIELARTETPADAHIADQSRNQILWLFGFFEGQLRADRAVAMIQRYLNDRPTDSAKVALAYRVLTDLLAWAAQRRPTERIDHDWLNQRHTRFDAARAEIATFVNNFAKETDWTNKARLLTVDSFDTESQLAVAVSPVQAGGLLVRSAAALLELLTITSGHPDAASFPGRLVHLAERLQGLGQHDPAIYIYSQVPIKFPTDPLASQSVLKIAELYAANLADPVKAVETYQEYLSLNGDNEPVRAQIFGIAQQLAGLRRYVEAIHVYAVFVDSFPTDPRAAAALQAIGQTHQSNQVWQDAIDTYQRILTEFPATEIAAPVKLAVAECQINLSQWRAARRLYEEYIQQFPNDGQVPMVTLRLEVLKNLERYQALLADADAGRHKDDAQFQIARIVLDQLQNAVKAVEEFRKVVAAFPESDVADDAQLEVGKALLQLDRPDEGRDELLKVALNYPNSPVADDALFLIGESYVRQAERLATVTVAQARDQAFEAQQRGNYALFNKELQAETRRLAEIRDELKREGNAGELDLNEATAANRFEGLFKGQLNNARQAQMHAETESALQVANRQDRINDAFREAVALFVRSATEHPLGDKADDSLLRTADILEANLKDRAAAMQTYQHIVKLFPGTPVAEDAAWRVAQFQEQEGKFIDAASALRDFLRNYPASSRAADAQFALAEVLEELGRWVEAMDAYETFRQKFDQHPKARVAMEQINWIKTYRK